MRDDAIPFDDQGTRIRAVPPSDSICHTSPKSGWESGAGLGPPSCSTMSGTVLLWATITTGQGRDRTRATRPGVSAGSYTIGVRPKRAATAAAVWRERL